jgi:putative ABC transport system ATP-binding protein
VVQSPPRATPLLEARDLSRKDQSGATSLLHPTDFTLHAGQQVAVTGASGSGKSVLLRALALLDAPDSGEVLWQGKPISGDLIPGFRTCVSYVSQRPGLIEGTVEDNLRLPFTLKALKGRGFDRQIAVALLAEAGKPPSFLGKAASDLSGGEAQVLALVRVLQLAPQVMLLDEPTSALDPESATAVEKLVAHWFAQGAGRRAYIWVSHDLDQAQRMSSTHLTMHQGSLAVG